MIRLLAIIGLLCSFSAHSQGLVINELMADNEATILEKEIDCDWIELYNASSAALPLANYYLSDEPDNLFKWALPNITLEANGFLLLYADEGLGALHTNFKINKNGEAIYLSTTAGVIDSFPAIPLKEDESYGRFPDGGNALFLFQQASPKAMNIQSDHPLITIAFSKITGLYSSEISLELRSSSPNSQIYYTLDGSPPTLESNAYTTPLQINSSSSPVNNAFIATAENWSAPQATPFKGNVVRAIAYIDSNISSQVYTHTYFVHPNIEGKYRFPIVSIVIDSMDLFSDDRGVYVNGNHRNFSQRGREWERRAHIELLTQEGTLALSQDIGIRTYGNKGRTLPQKSLLLYARSDYGKKRFKHQLFTEKETDSFKRLILRSASSNDWKNTLFKNELAQRMVTTLDLEHPATKAVIVFINGEYWGIHHLSERMDEHFLEDYFSIDEDSLDYLSSNALVEEGSNESYLEFVDYIQTNSLENATHYNYVTSQIDLSNFIDYAITELFFSNTDWPNNNIKFWRPKEGKWRWLFFDCDECMSYEYYDLLGDFMHEQSYHEAFPKWSTALLHRLLQNQQFKQRFRARFEELLFSTFSTQTMINHIDSMKAYYTPEVHAHAVRWNAPIDFFDWKEAVDGLYSFAAIRPTQMSVLLHEYFGNPFSIYPNPTKETVYINTKQELVNEAQLSIYNSQGVLVETRECCNSSINITHLRQGIYLFRIRLNNTFYSERVLIKRE